MSLERRLSKLEQAARAKTGGDMAIFDADGNEVVADIIQEPKPGIDGLALYDGKEIPVVLQDQDPVVMVFYHDDPEADDKLFFRKRDTEFVKVITAIPRIEDETE